MSRLGVVFAATACKPAGDLGPTTGPTLELTPKLDLGPMVQYETVRHSVPMANTGSKPLDVLEVLKSRLCSGHAQPTTLGPRARGRLEVRCWSDLYGPLRERLVLRTNEAVGAERNLELVATVTPLLAFDTEHVEMRVGFGQTRSEEVHLVGTKVAAARARLDAPGHAGVSIEPLSPKGGAPQGYRITCMGQQVGMHAASLIVNTGLERPRRIALPYRCTVTGTLSVSPTNPYFNLRLPGEKSQVIDVRSSQPDFEVQGVRVLDGPFSAVFERSAEPNAFRVTVIVLDERLDREARSATGRLVILSNDRTEPEKELPLFGFGRVHRAR